MHRATAGRPRSLLAPAVLALLGLASMACSAAVTTSSAPTTAGPGTTAATSQPSTTGSATTGTTPAAPTPSKGCSAPTPPAEDAQKHTLVVAGQERYYLLTTPPSSPGGQPLPLVVDLHGLSEGAETHTKMSMFGETGKAHGFVVVTPHGQGQPVHWDASPASQPNHDIELVDAFLDDIEATRCIDTSRIYATGLSYGAIMSSFLACVRTDRFAAVAPVAGITIHKGCTPTRPMPVITFHGTADPILKFNGGVDLSGIGGGATPTTAAPVDLNGPGYPANTAEWAQRNGCKATPTDTRTTPSVIHRVYDCPADAAVELYIVEGGGHAWPGSAFSASIEKYVGPTTTEIDANDLIWAFFQRFHR
jgi:polyhydroxybutyrate depolymerase